MPDLPDDLPDPVASAIRTVDLDALRSALASLPRRQRNAFLLRELGGLSYGELGLALGISTSAVESLLFRARQQLRALLSGANVAAVPFALRDELARLIPGFDPGTASLVARIAALPAAAKLATVALGVGVVATGAAEVPRDHAGATRTEPSSSSLAVVRPERHQRLPTVVAPRIRTPVKHVAEPERAEAEHERAEVEREPAGHEQPEIEEHDGAPETAGADD